MTPVEAARGFLGVRFQHQGRSEHGLDCAGLVIASWARCGVILGDVPGYGREPWKDGLRAAIEREFTPAIDGDRQPGDLLLFKIISEPQHIAIVTDRGIIHAYAQARKVVETRLGLEWIDRIVGHYRR